MKKASEEIQTKTQDSVKITWYFSGAAGDEPEVAKKLKQGEIDCAALTGNGISYVIPFMRLLELPFLFRSYDEVSYIKDEMQKLFAKISADYNVKFISFADLGFVYIFSKQPISNIDDIKGKTLWVWKNDFRHKGHKLTSF
jgi:TRAP-type C4-dicarboxylate transport system substrate-binding protein